MENIMIILAKAGQSISGRTIITIAVAVLLGWFIIRVLWGAIFGSKK
jgi:hypothetical protein